MQNDANNIWGGGVEFLTINSILSWWRLRKDFLVHKVILFHLLNSSFENRKHLYKPFISQLLM